MKHQHGWASIAKEVEVWIKKTYPKSLYMWVKPIEHLKGDEYGGGRIQIVAKGYRTGEKTHIYNIKDFRVIAHAI